MATTVFPTAMAGITRDKNPSKGASAGQTIPTVPIGSCIASVTLRNGGSCTAPSYLSAQAAYEKTRSMLWLTSAQPAPSLLPRTIARRSLHGAGTDFPRCSKVLGRGYGPLFSPTLPLCAPLQRHCECLCDFQTALRRASFHPRRALRCCSQNPGAPACRRCTASPCGQSAAPPRRLAGPKFFQSQASRGESEAPA